MTKIVASIISCFAICGYVSAGTEGFKAGPVFAEFGKHAAVVQSSPVNNNAKFKVAFDVSEASKAGDVNRSFNSLARFINMHVANGVKLENITLALVVHGKASNDLLIDKEYLDRFGENNANKKLITQLFLNNTKVYLCGQSASYYQIENHQLLPGVEMALSAMTAHAQLQQQGFSLNPF